MSVSEGVSTAGRSRHRSRRAGAERRSRSRSARWVPVWGIVLWVISFGTFGCSLTNPKSPLAGQTRLPSLERAELGDTAWEELPKGWVTAESAPAAGETLGESFDRLVQALEDAGFDKWSVYACEDGFALVTRIEQIDERGAPTGRRFEVRNPPPRPEGFSLDEHRSLLFMMSPARYRFFVFTVASRGGGTRRSADLPIDGDDVGALELADELHDVRGEDWVAQVAVIELERGADTQKPAERAAPGASVREHLERAGLWRGKTP